MSAPERSAPVVLDPPLNTGRWFLGDTARYVRVLSGQYATLLRQIPKGSPMADDQTATKVSYPYMSAAQLHGVRAKLRLSVPNTVDVNWVMAALGTSDKGARNIVPQLKAIGLIAGDGKPVSDLVHDLRGDDTYGQAYQTILEKLYPAALLGAWDDPGADTDKVADWFMRNAGTGAATAKLQAKLYLLLLKAELPSSDGTTVKKPSSTPIKKAAVKVVGSTAKSPVDQAREQTPPPPPPGGSLGPNLHIDMQIHIAADASDSQIDTIFKSMAKHLYGRE